MQESRLFKILYYILENKKATAPELADKFEVSVRTIYRDIDTLSSAGIPIYATRGKGGGIFILDGFVMDRALLDEKDRQDILFGLQGLNAIDDVNANYLLSKLSSIFHLNGGDWIEVDFFDWKNNAEYHSKFEYLKNAILNKRLVTFEYYSGRGKIQNRSVEPLKIVVKKSNWYLYGFCRLRKDYRLFKFNRICKLQIKDTTFSRTAPPKVITGIEKNEETVLVSMKFSPHLAFRVYDEFSNENVLKVTNDAIYAQIELPLNENILCSYLMSFSDGVEVIEPKYIRNLIKQKIENMSKIYRT